MSPDQELVTELTRRIAATDGVRGIFPMSVLAAAVATLVKSDQSEATGLVHLTRDGETMVVTARLAVDMDTPSALVAERVQTTAQQVLGADLRLHLEIAHLT